MHFKNIIILFRCIPWRFTNLKVSVIVEAKFDTEDTKLTLNVVFWSFLLDLNRENFIFFMIEEITNSGIFNSRLSLKKISEQLKRHKIIRKLIRSSKHVVWFERDFLSKERSQQKEIRYYQRIKNMNICNCTMMIFEIHERFKVFYNNILKVRFVCAIFRNN